MTKVCVIGGGIGGLALAIGMHRQGVEVEVVERDKDWKVYHVGIIVQANFLRALDQIELSQAAVAAGFPYRGARFCAADGTVLGQTEEEALPNGLPANLGLTRPALHDVLTRRVRDLDIPVRLGVKFETFDNRPDGVSVTFTDGTSGHYDLLVGADGNYSAVRKVLWPDAAPKYTGQGVWRYNVPRPADLEWSDIYIGKPDNRFRGKAGYCPLTPETMYVFAVIEEPGNPYFPPESLAVEMVRRLEGYGGIMARSAQYISDPAQVVYRPLEACIMPDPWFEKRVVLIGDAAHAATPHLGQGAAMAVEDAVVLAEEVALASKGSSDMAAALSAFMKRRFERAKLVGSTSIQLGEWEMKPESAGDPMALAAKVREVLAQPI